MRIMRFAVCVILAFAAGLLTQGQITTEVYAETTYDFTCARSDAADATKFTVPSLKLTGVCCQQGVKMKAGKATLKRLSNSSDYAKVAYYWGVLKGYDKSAINSTSRKHLTMMMQYINDPKAIKDFYYVKSGNCKKDISKARTVSVPDTFVIYKGNPTNKSQDFIVWRNTTPCSVTLRKASSDPAFSAASGYSFDGIRYQVYRSDGQTAVGVLTCGHDGTTNTLTGLEKGTYYAQEISANQFYAYNAEWLSVTVAEGGIGVFYATDAPLRGRLRIEKGSTDPNSINAGYNFEGVVYGVYETASGESRLLAELPLDASGKSELSPDLPVGTRYIREIKTNPYYKLAEETYPVVISGGNISEIKSDQLQDEPVTGTVSIVKHISGGNAVDEEFVFEMINRSNSSISYQNIRVKGDGTPTQIDVLAGEYTLRETGSGDYMDETGDQTVTVKEGETVRIERVNRHAKPGTLQLQKTTDDGGPRSGFRFKVSGTLKNQGILTADQLLRSADPKVRFTGDDKSYELGEWTVDQEDLQKLNSAAEEHKTGKHTVKIGTYATPAESGGSSGDTSSEEDSGGEGSGDDESDGGSDEETAEQTDESGEEGSEDTGEGGDEDADPAAGDDGKIEVSAEVLITLDEVYWDAGKLTYIGKATDARQSSVAGKGYELTLNDFTWRGAATAYRDIDTGADHTILITNDKGHGINESTGKEGIDPIFVGDYEVTEVMDQAQSDRYHEAQSQKLSWNGQGSASLIFNFNNRARTVPVKLVKKSIDGKVSGIGFRLSGKTAFGDVVSRTGITDSSGSIDFGVVAKGSYVVEEIGWDEENYANNHRLDGYSRPAIPVEVRGDETDDIVVSFENVPYSKMRISKVDSDTGRFLPGATFSVVNITDNIVEGTFELIEEGGFPQVRMIGSGSALKRLNVNMSGTESETQWIGIGGLTHGKDYRVIETDPPVGYGVAEAAVEFKASFDREEIIKFEDKRSAIETVASDADTGEHVSLADDDVTIRDTVAYRNLVPGKEYRLEGTLMDRGQYLISNQVGDVVPAKDASGKAIKAELKFKPETADGKVRIDFKFNGSELGGSSLVVYEKLYLGSDLVCSHEDPASEDQTIEMPGIQTNATSERSHMHIDNAQKEVVINDLISYSNLSVGVDYHLSGILMDKSSGKPLSVGGRQIRSETDFTPESSTGSVTLSFSVDASDLAGRAIVAFEELACNGRIVAEHKDIGDASQTIDIPAIRTLADRPSKNRIEDKVSYSGLIPGEKYVMSGVLVDKASGTELEATRSEIEFTPAKSKGKIVVPFSISADDLIAKGIRDLVVFERCDVLVDLEGEGRLSPVEIASHRDIDDKNQMVALLKPKKETHTGDDVRPLWLAGILMLCSLAVITRLRRRVR